MKTFIENYLLDPSQAIANARGIDSWADSIDDNMIYEQLASGEFRLYEEIVCCDTYRGESESSFRRGAHWG